MDKNINPQEVKLQKYETEYSEKGLWKKVSAVAKAAGAKVIYYALLLYYALQSPQMTFAHKAKIMGALGYFILPADLIPDAIALLGFTDDAAILLYVIKKIHSAIDDDTKKRAEEKLKEWFGEYNKDEIKGI